MAEEQKLLEQLEQESKSEREQLLAEAKKQADALAAEARRDADRLIEEARRGGEKRGTVEVDRRVGLARQEVGLAVLETKHQVLKEINQDLAGRIGELRKREGYPEALGRWTREVADRIGEGAVVHTHPDDRKTVQAVLKEQGIDLKVEGDDAIQGGVKAVSGDGRIVADNTFGARLAQAHENLDEVLGRALFGDENAGATA
jgi:vacuolar-type H+-ATPase subunit E/Vma4